MCSNVNSIVPMPSVPKVLTYPIHTIASKRNSAGAVAMGSAHAIHATILTENLHATTSDGLFSSATAIYEDGVSALDLGQPKIFGLLSGALATIGSAVLPSLVNVGIDVVKKIFSEEELNALPFEPATVASVSAVMRLGDPGQPGKLYEIGRFGFECTPNSVIASETPPAVADGIVLPESFGALAACLLAEGGQTLFQLLRDNVGELNGFDEVSFRRFLNAVLAQSGGATVELIQRAINNCLSTR